MALASDDRRGETNHHNIHKVGILPDQVVPINITARQQMGSLTPTSSCSYIDCSFARLIAALTHDPPMVPILTRGSRGSSSTGLPAFNGRGASANRTASLTFHTLSCLRFTHFRAMADLKAFDRLLRLNSELQPHDRAKSTQSSLVS